MMWPIGFYKIYGKSMEPAFRAGDYMLVNYWNFVFRSPRKGDVVLIRHPKKGVLLKRISKIKGQKYYVIGDNPLHSTDSRHFGLVSKRQIIGSILFHIPHH